MTFVTAQGQRLETIEVNGRSTPFQHGEYMVLRVAVNGHPYPAWQIPAADWNAEAATLEAGDFWQNVADAALSMGDVQAALR